MPAAVAPTGESARRHRQLAVLTLERAQGVVATVPRIDVEHEQTRTRVARNPNIRLGPALPPRSDRLAVGRGGKKPGAGERILSARPARKHRPA
jgi:hypothetical protein